MDEYAAFLRALDVAVWPLVVLAIASAFRQQIVQLVARLTKARVPGVGEFDFGLLDEAEFEGKAAEKEKTSAHEGTQKSAEPAKPAKPAESADGGSEEEESNLDMLISVARHSPQAAIIEAWAEIEMAVQAVRREILPHVHRNEVISRLEKQGVLSETTAAQFVRLLKLRNEAAHAFERNIDASAAQTYAKLAFQLAEELRAKPKWFDTALCRVYELFNVPTDQLLQNRALGDQFVAKFVAETGMHVEAQVILDRLIYLRKRGRLPNVRR